MTDLFSYTPERYPNAPGYKARSTSKRAAAEMKPVAPTLRDQCFEAIKRAGSATADEIADAVGKSIMSVRPRISELATMEKIADSGQRRHNDSGKSAIVWRLA